MARGPVQGDEAARGTILAAFQAWGWRADPELDARSPGILSSVAAAPGIYYACVRTYQLTLLVRQSGCLALTELHSLAAAPQPWAYFPTLLERDTQRDMQLQIAGAAASYLYQWVPSLGWGRARRGSSGSGGGQHTPSPIQRRPLSVRTTPPRRTTAG